ncbi:hypothetical protein [Gloeocapsopsis dulcis]|uniref:Uncharacterized protein n=1 Tax=Gloeocapsopsis dulcis AAB1 = 1H9 TaxID=1433147 RepID=A0A6N8FVP5_9CHRO|nr:hypothetical protein [Gloeocapsopsis dulcis]MUL36844.1 hypothetical protein [Gloeocapsopsis dulcis AAB1 = 1H9]WNN88549.1 hypothetical protein P0S91_20020 [Gloeocapsopsis dulcis]
MWKDEIVEEIHQIREAYAKSFNYDLDAIFEDLRKKESESGREVVSLSRKRGLTTRWSGRVRDLGGDAESAKRRSP